MAAYKTTNREPGKTIRIGGREYKYQCGFAFLDNAVQTARDWRKQGLFVKMIKVVKKGYRPSYLIYISPKKTKKQPHWFRRNN